MASPWAPACTPAVRQFRPIMLGTAGANNRLSFAVRASETASQTVAAGAALGNTVPPATAPSNGGPGGQQPSPKPAAAPPLPEREAVRRYFRTVYDFPNWRKHRDQNRLRRGLFTIHKSHILQNISPTLAYVALLSTTVAMTLTAQKNGLLASTLPDLTPANAFSTFVSSTSFVLSLLLVFRTNSSYGRWDEARKMWGGLLNRSRDVMRQAVTCFPDDAAGQASKQAFARWTVAFAHTLRLHFQPEARLEDLLKDVLKPEELKLLAASQHRPVCAIQALSQIIQSVPMNSVHQLQMSQNLTFFHDVLGGCERLLRAPIPLSYTRKTTRYLVLWLSLLPFALWQQCGWGIVPVCTGITAVLYGIDEIGLQCEEPFGILPLDVICNRITADVMATLKDDQEVRAELQHVWLTDTANIRRAAAVQQAALAQQATAAAAAAPATIADAAVAADAAHELQAERAVTTAGEVDPAAFEELAVAAAAAAELVAASASTTTTTSNSSTGVSPLRKGVPKQMVSELTNEQRALASELAAAMLPHRPKIPHQTSTREERRPAAAIKAQLPMYAGSSTAISDRTNAPVGTSFNAAASAAATAADAQPAAAAAVQAPAAPAAEPAKAPSPQRSTGGLVASRIAALNQAAAAASAPTSAGASSADQISGSAAASATSIVASRASKGTARQWPPPMPTATPAAEKTAAEKKPLSIMEVAVLPADSSAVPSADAKGVHVRSVAVSNGSQIATASPLSPTIDKQQLAVRAWPPPPPGKASAVSGGSLPAAKVARALPPPSTATPAAGRTTQCVITIPTKPTPAPTAKAASASAAEASSTVVAAAVSASQQMVDDSALVSESAGESIADAALQEWTDSVQRRDSTTATSALPGLNGSSGSNGRVGAPADDNAVSRSGRVAQAVAAINGSATAPPPAPRAAAMRDRPAVWPLPMDKADGNGAAAGASTAPTPGKGTVQQKVQ